MRPADALFATLQYADRFGYAPTDAQVSALTFGYHAAPPDLTGLADDRVTHARGRWCLRGRETLLDASDTPFAVAKTARAHRLLPLFAWLPWLELVALTGSVAAGSAHRDDDIDLLIITRPGRLWLSRLILTPILSLLRLRRRPGDRPDHVSDKLCLNMWLTTAHLIEPIRDRYAANELIRVQPLLDRHHAHGRYLVANTWLATQLPLWTPPSLPADNAPAPSLLHPVLTWLDDRARELQYRLMRPRTNEYVTRTRLHFHPHDYRADLTSLSDPHAHGQAGTYAPNAPTSSMNRS